jgi:WD40 repeat protein
MEVHDDEVWICSFSPDGKYLASACRKNRLSVLEIVLEGNKFKSTSMFSEVVHSASIS